MRLLPGFAYQLQQRRSRQVGFAGEIEGQTDKKLDEKDRQTPQGEGVRSPPSPPSRFFQKLYTPARNHLISALKS